MPKNTHLIVKSTGEQEVFSEEKLNKHLLNNGIDSSLASSVVTSLEKDISNIHSTDDIYLHVSNFLREQGAMQNYFNYGLRRAVNLLGPSGHPFEYFIGEVLAEYGYRTEVGVVALGRCVTHEIDVMAAKDHHQFLVECKFHNATGTKTDIQVALYTYARFLDVKYALEQTHGKEKEYIPWLITNTKVTSEVFDYADCVGLKVTAWYYPEGEGLRDMIISSGLHPVTLLYHVSTKKINELVSRNIVTVSSLKKAIKMHTIDDLLTDKEIDHILKDINCLTKNEPCN